MYGATRRINYCATPTFSLDNLQHVLELLLAVTCKELT